MNKKIHKKQKIYLTLFLLATLLCIGIWIDILAGYRKISIDTLLQILTGSGEQGLRYTLLQLRFPRVLISLLVGIGLSVSGCVMQGVSGNDMAEPGILGINAGAGLFLAIFMVFFGGSGANFSLLLPALALLGSLFAAFTDYRLAMVGGKVSPRRLLLVGVAMSMAISSATTMLMLHMSDSEYAFVQSWISGNIWGASWPNVYMMGAGLLLLTGFVFYKSRTLNVLALGHETALALGVHISRQRFLLLAASIGMSSLCCAVGGGLSFIGLICPHLSRKLVGPDFRYLLPAAVLSGALLMVFSDIISRTLLSPAEIPVGIVASVIGAPYFLYLLIKS